MKLNKLTLIIIAAISFSCSNSLKKGYSRYDYPNILDISYTPNNEVRCAGWFTDSGSWWGFTPAQKGAFINGFCGPFHLDMNKREWYSGAIVTAAFAKQDHPTEKCIFALDSISYFPGELYMKSTSAQGSIEQSLVFADKSNVLLEIKGDKPLSLSGKAEWGNKWFSKSPLTMDLVENSVVIKDTLGEGFAVTFEKGTKLSLSTLDSSAISYTAECKNTVSNVIISFFIPGDNLDSLISDANNKLLNTSGLRKENLARWNGYFSSVIREDMPMEYNRIAAKAVTTLIANWRSARRDLFHDGVVPSHAVGYFVGFWGWDSWKHAVALAHFAPELAKNQVRAMYDYQIEDGMIIDCIYSDQNENNARDSKPPLSAWAVNEIYKVTKDSAFVKEMFPKMLSYYEWWYKYRDHNHNGVCEYGSCDGTLEAAAWESGMDNAIRFDDAVMVYNGKKDKKGGVADNGKGGWSMNRESVDLNAFLAYEHKLLGELSHVAGIKAAVKDTIIPDINKPYPINIADYFFCKERGFFFDRLFDGSFVTEEGTEACIPLWTGIATKEQAAQAALIFTNTNKFATYIPFPTIAADNPKFMPAGYWRGPIWLDQVYFGINGLRKYEYIEQADSFTRDVFDRLYGLKEGAPIHENYNTHNGSLLKAPHFSWSSAHLLMMYMEYGKKLF